MKSVAAVPAGLAMFLGLIAVLLVFTLLFGLLAVMRFRWRIED